MEQTVAISLIVTLLSGCASQGPQRLPDETLGLGEVREVASIESVASSIRDPAKALETARRWGFTDEQIERGQMIRVRLGALVPEGMSVDIGNVVEFSAFSRPMIMAQSRRRHRRGHQCERGAAQEEALFWGCL